jgi:cytochrome oxidase Cu insertion factor (SCO1/SenC/PrrC family)
MTAQESITSMSEPKPNRMTLWALMIVTGLPFLLALYLFLNPEMLEVLGTKNHGKLVQPTRDLPALQVQTLDGNGLNLESLKGNWTLVMVGDGDCAESCQKNLYYMRQIRRAMGENRTRVQRLMVVRDGRLGPDLQAVLKPFEGTRVIVGPDAALDQLLAWLRVDDAPLLGRMYIVDPQGKLILAYPPNPPWKDVLKDLEHLLKVVQL